MIIITVARKSLEGTVAQNATKHGTGALNIDGARVAVMGTVKGGVSDPANRRGETGPDWQASDKERMAQVQQESILRTNTLGRWPANFILQHSPDCQCHGTKRVKSGNATLVHTEEGRNIGVVNLLGLKRAAAGTYGHADADSMETVPDWVCAPGCPVRALDGQSVTRLAGVAVRRNQGRSQEGMFTFGNLGPEEDVGYADEGTASRYFKQVK